MKALDPLAIPLTGTSLIEASAGTGKTFTIAILFLRLLLEKKLNVEQILVVTFTKAATAELRERIRSRLHAALQAFTLDGEVKDECLAALVQRCDQDEAVSRLRQALACFDEAGIFTIHGFCQRVLTDTAFESNALFENEIITDQSKLLQALAEDFWRQTVYPAPGAWTDYLLTRIKGPDQLRKLFGRYMTGAALPLLVADMPLAPDTDRRFQEIVAAMRREWGVEREAIATLLLENTALNGTKYKKGNIPAWLRQMQDWLDGDSALLFDDFHRFTVASLRAATKKGQVTPDHPFFTLCDQIQQLVNDQALRLSRFKQECIEFGRRELAGRKRKQNLLSYDDLLTDLHQALTGAGGEALRQAIRTRYPAALIDEFQDTDTVQYTIFSTLYAGDQATLFLIGDPKQAIYGFRGADIFAYMAAVRHTRSRYTLATNWRSEAGLIQAVNVLFQNNALPFIFTEIPYWPVTAAPKSPEESPVLTVDNSQEPPLHFWFVSEELAPAGRSGLIKKEWALPAIAAATAGEIVRLLALAAAGRARIGEKPLAAGDIAILVRSHSQAAVMQKALRERDVPSVLSSQESLFATQEAEEVERLLTALVNPGNDALLRGAMVGGILGLSANTMLATVEDPVAWDARLVCCQEDHDLWHGQGFIRMFRRLLIRENIPARLLEQVGGERRLTNILHLAEILEQAELEGKLGQAGLLQWLREQRYNPGQNEERQLRLESDEKRVKIVTIHKSKGLEYGVVFCPFAWDGKLHSGGLLSKETRKSLSDLAVELARADEDGREEACRQLTTITAGLEPLTFHDQQADQRLSLDLGSHRWFAHYEQARLEEQAENLRLLYVAVTRARHRCYLVWGKFTDFASSPLAYLLYQPGIPENLASHSDADMRQGLERLAAKAAGTILVRDMPDPEAARAGADREIDLRLAARDFSGIIRRDWQVSSFTALAAAGASHHELPDRDQQDMALTPSAVAGPATEDIFAFPRGAAPGTLIHRLFELLDFQEQDEAKIGLLVTQVLRQYNTDEHWAATLTNMVRNVLATPMPSPDGPLRLREIAVAQRLTELEFYYPLARITPQGLARQFRTPVGSMPVTAVSFAADASRLQFSPVRGFMKGYIDLIFAHRGRFYLADYKSNHLGANLKDYGQPALTAVMRREQYYLQYHLYGVALHRYLATRLPDYAYDRHFGGVYYLFVRGMRPALGPAGGVFFDRPAESCLVGLSDYLAGLDQEPV